MDGPLDDDDLDEDELSATLEKRLKTAQQIQPKMKKSAQNTQTTTTTSKKTTTGGRR